MIQYDDFAKLDIRMGTVLEVVPVEGADKLLQLTIDLGLKPFSKENGSPDHSPEANGLGEERDIRTLVSGIRAYFEDISVLVGVQVPVIVNLEPRTIRGVTSEGMVMYVVGEDMLTTLSPGKSVPNGTPVR